MGINKVSLYTTTTTTTNTHTPLPTAGSIYNTSKWLYVSGLTTNTSVKGKFLFSSDKGGERIAVTHDLNLNVHVLVLYICF